MKKFLAAAALCAIALVALAATPKQAEACGVSSVGFSTGYCQPNIGVFAAPFVQTFALPQYAPAVFSQAPVYAPAPVVAVQAPVYAPPPVVVSAPIYQAPVVFSQPPVIYAAPSYNYGCPSAFNLGTGTHYYGTHPHH